MTRILAILSNSSGVMLLAFTRRWLPLATVALGVYITLPWLAPALAKVGAAGPANFIYTIYSPFCHQFAFRSPFLFGAQAFYPREIAGSDYATFETFAADSDAFAQEYRYWSSAFGRAASDSVSAADLLDFSPAQQFAARHFVGDATMGYKTTLCARDMAIYTMLFVGCLIYWRFRWRIRPLPLWLYIFAGMGPMAIDGFSQLLGYPPFDFWQPRETLPIFRALTGGMFGLMSAWLALPHFDRSMREIREGIQWRGV